MMDIKEIEEKLAIAFSQVEIDASEKQILLKAIYNILLEVEEQNRLSMLYEYEKHYLELLQEHKDEIKFANSIQEDLRRERSQFFTYGLREVCETLKNSGVDNAVASQWLQELVHSYTKSLDVSADLATNQVVDIIGKLREETKQEVKQNQKKNNPPKTNTSQEQDDE